MLVPLLNVARSSTVIATLRVNVMAICHLLYLEEVEPIS